MSENNKHLNKIAIIGGGVAGSSLAVYLGEIGLQVELFEKGTSLVNGPPICHLHAGGNLYREIPDDQCVTLLKESIEALRFYPHSVDYRPTVIAVPQSDPGNPLDLLPRLTLLQQEYQKLIDQDPGNQVLGKASEYYQLFEREDLLALQQEQEVAVPQTPEQWMIPVAKHVDLASLKFPLVLVQEYGWNVFRLGASASLSLEKNTHCKLHLNSKVNALTQADSGKWLVNYQLADKDYTEEFDFVINASGFKTGEIDDLAGFKRQRLVEFKAAYVTKWQGTEGLWPEIIFHGERGTPEGMAQFTPYPDNYIQLHGMTEQITLFEDGLVASSEQSAQPQLDAKFLRKIESGWLADEIEQRGQRAINHMARFIPSFEQALVQGKPLFGAQQIPGDDVNLRAAGVSFEGNNYARCEIVKASSVLSSADAITKKLQELGFVSASKVGSRTFPITHSLGDPEVTARAEQYTLQRDYPQSLAYRNIKNNLEY